MLTSALPALSCSSIPGLGQTRSDHPVEKQAPMGKGLPESPAAPLQEAATKNTIETELGRLWGGADLQNDGGGENRVLAVVDGREIRASDLFQT